MLLRCLGLAMVAATAHADDAVRHFDIQSQGAASALNEFARQADITLVFASAMVARHQSVSVRRSRANLRPPRSRQRMPAPPVARTCRRWW